MLFLQSGALLRAAASSLHICVLAKEDLNHTKDAKFAPGIQVSCPYLQCNFKNSQFNEKGRFPSGKVNIYNKHFQSQTNFESIYPWYLIDVIDIIFDLEFLLNHLHSNHKHRRFNGDNLDLTMVVPQVVAGWFYKD